MIRTPLHSRNEINQFIYSNYTGFLLTILIFLFQLIGITHHSFWGDEFSTYEAVRLPFNELIKHRLTAGHFPLYFIFIKYWCKFFGFSELSMRIPSVIFSSLSFLAFYFLTKRYIRNLFTFLIANILFFFHPFMFWAAQEARMYSLLIFISIISSYYLLLFVETRKNSYLLWYTLSILIGVNLHIVFPLQIIVHFIYILIQHRRLISKWSLTLIIPGISFIIMFYLLLTTQEKYSQDFIINYVRIGKFLRKIASLSLISPSGFYGDFPSLEKIIEYLPIPFFLIFLLSSITLRIKSKAITDASSPKSNEEKKKKAFLLDYTFYWLIVTVILFYIIGTFFYDKTGGRRHYCFLVPPMTIIMAIGFTYLKNNTLRQIIRFLFMLVLSCMIFLQMSWSGVGVRQGIDYLKENYKQGDGVVFCREEGLKNAFFLYNVAYMNRVGISKNLEDEKEILSKVQNFSNDKQRLWLFIYMAHRLPILDLLEKYPETFTKFTEKTISEVVIKGFFVQKAQE